SRTEFVSSGTRLVASLSNATKRPSLDSEGERLLLSGTFCESPTLTCSNLFDGLVSDGGQKSSGGAFSRSRMKMSLKAFVSSAVRWAALAKPTNRPSAERAGGAVRSAPLFTSPTAAGATHSVLAVQPFSIAPSETQRSRTKMPPVVFPPEAGLRLAALLANA